MYPLNHKIKTAIVYFITLLFLAAGAYYLVKSDSFFVFILPLFLLAGLLFFTSPKNVFCITVFSTPFAIDLTSDGSALSIPTEPLLIGILILFLFKFILEGYPDKKIFRHPVAVTIIVYLLWVLITSFTSQMPLVSIKSLIARLWFIIPMVFIGILLYKKLSDAKGVVWAYALALAIICLITTYTHAQYGFSERVGHSVMSPYYNDHTAYGAILTLFLPVTFYFIFDKSYSKLYRSVAIALTAVLFIALFFSYCRAAWVSLVGALLVFLVIWFRIKLRWILISAGILIVLFFTFQFEIVYRLEKNKQNSSQNFVEHLQSITNISSDASNMERINRWQSAIRMWEDRPFWGWGPGTYQFFYAPYQSSTERTVISTNSGDLGNVHSEYLGPLTDSGLIGLLTFLGIICAALYTGIKVFRKAAQDNVRFFALALVIGLVSYFIHGIMNNFLDTDKLAVPVWGFIGILMALDIYHSRSLPSTVSQKNSLENQG